jgi:hypothetical protein
MEASRDMKRVPRSPDTVALRIGDRVCIQVAADQAGYRWRNVATWFPHRI